MNLQPTDAPVNSSDFSAIWVWMFPAICGLVGVLIGGAITMYSAKLDRRNKFRREQLTFYGSMLGLRKRIQAKTEARIKAKNAARKIRDQKTAGLVTFEKERERLLAEFQIKRDWEAALAYDKKQIADEIVPAYRAMLDLWNSNIALSLKSTNVFYKDFVEYVEVWNRSIAKAGDFDALFELKFDEQNLFPLYEDIEQNMEKLQKEVLELDEFDEY